MATNFSGRDGYSFFTGVVEDRNDPLRVGRVRVRCLGYHTENKTELPTVDLPWASVMAPTTSPSMSGLGSTPSFLVEGSWVVGFFRDADLQEPLVIGTLPGIPSTLADTKQGFNDPNGTYPRAANEPDTSSLARGTQKYPVTLSDSIGIPSDPYAGEYPKVHVYETESGHLKEYDDTENNERIRERHKSGTFYEIHPNGDKVQSIVHDQYTLVAGNDSIQVKGNVRIVVEGDVQLTAATGTINIASGDVIANGISLVNHTHTDTAGLAAGTTTKPNS